MLYLDFEYHDRGDKNLQLLCAATQLDGVSRWYPLQISSEVEALKQQLRSVKKICCYSSSAEGSGIEALGLDSLSYEYVDLYWMFTMARNGLFNLIIPGGDNAEDTPGPEEEAIPEVKKKKPVKKSLLNACLLLDVPYLHDKGKTLDLILSKDTFTSCEWADIRKYNEEDVRVLPLLREKLEAKLISLYKLTRTELDGYTQYNSKYGARIARVSRIGFPVDMGAARRLTNTYTKLVAYLQHEINANYYPVYANGKLNHDRQVQQLQKLGVADVWPRSEKSGKHSFSRDVIKLSKTIPVVQLYEKRRELDTLKFFRPEGEVYNAIGADGFSRAAIIPFGQLSGRNTVRGREYILVMSTWLRSLIRPRPGYCIVSADYSCQEFAAAAALSEDINMLRCYNSGDPYLEFGKMAGAVPPDGKREDYEDIRDLFKSTTLGLQFSMGVERLAHKLSVDTGKPVTEAQAMKLRDAHRTTFKTYWKWVSMITQYVKNCEPLTLRDGWSTRTDPDFITSYTNFPIQGTGAVILRKAVSLLQDAGVPVCSTLHDAIYIYCKKEDAEHNTKKLIDCMQAASDETLDNKVKVRIDTKIQHDTDFWVDKKGKHNWEKFKHILYPKEFASGKDKIS